MESVTNGQSPDGKVCFTQKKKLVELTCLLAKHGEVQEDETYAYVPGWDDNRVLAEIKVERLPIDRIIKFRRDFFGLLASERKPKAVKPDASVMAAAIEKMAALESYAKSLERRVAALEDLLDAKTSPPQTRQ